MCQDGQYYKNDTTIESTVQISVLNFSYDVNQIYYVTVELSDSECLFGPVYKFDSSGTQIKI